MNKAFANLILVLSLFLGFHGASHADPAERAWASAAADTATTAVGLSAGLVELNPLGLAGSLVVKGVLMGYINSLPKEEQPQNYNVVSSIWGGAAASNLCWLTGAGPVCFLLGAATGGWMWSTGDAELKSQAAKREAAALVAQED